MTLFFATPHRWREALLVLVMVVFLIPPAKADPVGRIGRIASLTGQVQLYNASTGENENAVLNRPLTSGDVLTTAAGGRAEIHIGSLKLRVDSGSVLELTQIDDERIRLHLEDGSLIARLPSPEIANDFELDTRDGGFTALSAGHYRFDFDGASSAATAYSGALHFEADDSALDILAGQRAQFWNSGATHYRLSVPVEDSFAGWSRTRDQLRSNGAYARHVSPEMTGAEDLDAHGNWSETAEYGAVWYPRAVATDWAPYRSGRWVWIAPWGWNWVGNEPWGFAPFHYGRWVWHRNAWGWVPGARIARPVYAPALVGWVGGTHLNVAISRSVSPGSGWFPLAPREVYIPVYRSSPTYIRQVNITHVSNITNLTNIVKHPQSVMAQTHYAHRSLPHVASVQPEASRPAPEARVERRVERQVERQVDRSSGRRDERAEAATVVAPRNMPAVTSPAPVVVATTQPSPVRAEKAMPERAQLPTQPNRERSSRREEVVTSPVPQAIPQATVARVEAVPQREREAPRQVQREAQREVQRQAPHEAQRESRVEARREDRREAPREARQEAAREERIQAPREIPRQPERVVEVRKEQREERRQQPREEKVPQDNKQETGRRSDDSRKR